MTKPRRQSRMDSTVHASAKTAIYWQFFHLYLKPKRQVNQGVRGRKSKEFSVLVLLDRFQSPHSLTTAAELIKSQTANQGHRHCQVHLNYLRFFLSRSSTTLLYSCRGQLTLISFPTGILSAKWLSRHIPGSDPGIHRYLLMSTKLQV